MSAGRLPLSPFARRWTAAGALLLLLGVILGAFGSHLLAARLGPRELASFQTGVQYHLLHALGLVVLGVIGHCGGETRWLRASAALMAAGIVCFSGTIYAITAGAPRAIAVLAPVGGSSFMAAWALLALHARAAGRAAAD